MFTVLVVHEPVAPRSQVREYLRAFLDVPAVHVFYKIRKDRPYGEQVVGLEEFLENSAFTVGDDIPQGFSLAVGSFSTLLYEMVERGVPVGILKMSSTQAEDLVESGLAAFIDIAGPDFAGQMSRAADVPADEIFRRARKLRVNADIGETLNRLYYAP